VIVLNVEDDTDLNTFEIELRKEKSIPVKWRKYLVIMFKQQVAKIEEPEEIQDIVNSWRWIRKNESTNDVNSSIVCCVWCFYSLFSCCRLFI
jgi:hypothetical protein